MTNHLSRYERWYGRDEPPPETISLRAGRLTAEFQEGDLRGLQYGSLELIRRVYAAVRDPNWNTIPGQISGLEVEAGEDSFKITYQSCHQAGPLAFRWQARLEGSADGTVECTLEGSAGSAFRYNRIGWCVLQPIQGIAGQPFQAATQGGPLSGRLPLRIEPQRIVSGFESPIFPSFTSLSISLENGLHLFTGFEGDLFEMEDQRNWSDGSFKTYSTPLSLGYPHQARPGQSFFQKVTIRLLDRRRLEGQPPERIAAPSAAPLQLSLGEETGNRLPRLGFGLPGKEGAPGLAWSLREQELISRLRPDHLKLDLHLKDPDWPAQLGRSVQAAGQVGSPLELALYLTDDSQEALRRLSGLLEGVPLARVIVLHELETAQGATSARWMWAARQALGESRPALPFIGGTHGNFTQLNRQPPEPALIDGVAFPLNPQVHAFDERSLVEGLEAQRDMLTSARALAPGLPVAVSAVTLKPPFNQVAREAEAPLDPERLPANVDPRQVSLFAAAWTAGSLHALASGGASSVTYYETTGWRGLLESSRGSRLPARFRSFPGMIFPVYWVFAFLADAKSAALLDTRSDRPLEAGLLAMRRGKQAWLVVSSYLPREQEVRLSPLPGGQASRLRLNEETFALAATDPGTLLSGAEPLGLTGKEITLRVLPYETCLIAVNHGGVI